MLLARRARLQRGALETVIFAARMLLARGTFLMAATASAVTRGHVPSHQQQYDVPVRPPVVQVWYLKRYNYSPTGRIGDVQHGLERMEQATYYQFPAALKDGDVPVEGRHAAELFKASGFGDRGVRFAYWYDHGTISAPMPTTYDQLQRWITAGDFSQAFYINEDELETPEKQAEEAAAENRIEDLLSAAARGAHCDYCGDWCAHGEYDDDWMGTGLSVCYAGEHEAEKAESEEYYYYIGYFDISNVYPTPRKRDGGCRDDDESRRREPVSPAVRCI